MLTPAILAPPRAAMAPPTRRAALVAGLATVLIAAPRPRPARADDEDMPPPPPPPPAAADNSAIPGEAPIITELRARSVANKAAHDRERLDSYYRRNADALRVIDSPSLDPAIRARIQAWLKANE